MTPKRIREIVRQEVINHEFENVQKNLQKEFTANMVKLSFIVGAAIFVSLTDRKSKNN